MNNELPRDAEGREIPLDTKVLYDMTLHACDVHLTPPDSWEKLEEDLRRGADALNYEACAYFGKSACDCSSCIADTGETCERVAMRDIASRIRKLRGED